MSDLNGLTARSSDRKISFRQLLDALLDSETTFNPRFLYRLSDLESQELAQLAEVWPNVPLWRRQALMEDAEELSSRDMLLSFSALGQFAVKDEDPKVRLPAARTLWEYEETDLIPIFLNLLESDTDAEVRATAASALGKYVYAGELEDIPMQTLRKIEDLLLKTVRGDDLPPVRRAALEALGYSSREEIPPLIENAYASSDREWEASALYAMGRSGDERWQPQVLSNLESNIPLLRCEAARAAGELEFPQAVPLLLELLDDPDNSTRLASIWSLSQIGGEGVRETLEEMYEDAEDDESIELLANALENLAFNEGLQLMPLFDFPEYEEEGEELYGLIDNDDLDNLDIDEDYS